MSATGEIMNQRSLKYISAKICELNDTEVFLLWAAARDLQ